MGIFKKWFSKKEKVVEQEQPVKENNNQEESCGFEIKLVNNQVYPCYTISNSSKCAKSAIFMHVDEISRHVFFDCMFTNTYFNRIELEMTSFVNCTFNNVTFFNVNFNMCKFEKCTFDNGGTSGQTKFMNCVFDSTLIKECHFNNAMFVNVMSVALHDQMDLTSCMFGNFVVINSNINGFMFPKSEEMRYGKILKEPMHVWKTAIPILDEQYSKIKNEVKPNGVNYCPLDFIDEHGLNNGIPHPKIISTENHYTSFLALVELEIPAGAVVFTTDNYNFRANKAVVKNIYRKEVTVGGVVKKETIPVGQAVSKFDNSTMYVVGETMEVEDYPLNPTASICPGIYFYIKNNGIKELFDSGLPKNE